MKLNTVRELDERHTECFPPADRSYRMSRACECVRRAAVWFSASRVRYARPHDSHAMRIKCKIQTHHMHRQVCVYVMFLPTIVQCMLNQMLAERYTKNIWVAEQLPTFTQKIEDNNNKKPLRTIRLRVDCASRWNTGSRARTHTGSGDVAHRRNRARTVCWCWCCWHIAHHSWLFRGTKECTANTLNSFRITLYLIRWLMALWGSNIQCSQCNVKEINKKKRCIFLAHRIRAS